MGIADKGSIWPKVSLVSLGISFLFYLIAFGAPNWCKTDQSQARNEEHIGLWRYCTYPVGGGQSCDDFIDIIVGGKDIINSVFKNKYASLLDCMLEDTERYFIVIINCDCYCL